MILKLFNRARMFIKIFFFKLKYFNKIKLSYSLRFRKRFNIIMETNGKLVIGKNVFFNNDCSINCLGKVEIGDDCIFGENVKIYDHNHLFNRKDKIKSQGFSIGTVTIGNNCWIGTNVVILKGANIGDNCVIGAGVIVKENIPDNSIVRCKTNYEIDKIKFK